MLYIAQCLRKAGVFKCYMQYELGKVESIVICTLHFTTLTGLLNDLLIQLYAVIRLIQLLRLIGLFVHNNKILVHNYISYIPSHTCTPNHKYGLNFYN